MCDYGCCGNINTPGCTYTRSGRTDLEIACSEIEASGGIPALGETWKVLNCPDVYRSILYSNNGTLAYNPNLLARTQANIYNVMNGYIQQAEFTDDTSSPSYDKFQTTLADFCSNSELPGACDLFLENYCPNYTRDEIGKSNILTRFCGCRANDRGSASLPVPVQCDPLCHRIGVSQVANPATGTLKVCDNTVCVIDDVIVNLVNSEITSGIAFTQICGGCSSANPCTCIISGESVERTLDKSGVGLSYTQYCGDNAQCFTTDGKTLTKVKCPIAPVSYLWIVAIVVVLLIVIIAIVLRK